jgi:glycosyl transferase family 87
VTGAARKAIEITALGVVPLAALVLGLATFAGQDRLALDFHHELFPQAQAVVHGRDAYPPPDADLSDGTNAIWPMAAVLPVVPLTALPAEAADWVVALLVIATLVAALWVFGVRDWRVYGITLLWAPVIDAYQTGNATLPLVLLVALMWRYRSRTALAGAALGVALAVKFFLWPVVLWLAAARRIGAALVAVALAAASLLLLLPFTSIEDYLRLLRNLSDTFDALSYTTYALLVDLGAPSSLARAATLAAGAVVLALAWRRRSLGLFVGAALLLSPIVWRHFFALLVVPLALSRPRFDAVWLVPLAFWFVPGTYNGAPWQTALALVAGAATVALAERKTAPRALGIPHPTPITRIGRRSSPV